MKKEKYKIDRQTESVENSRGDRLIYNPPMENISAEVILFRRGTDVGEVVWEREDGRAPNSGGCWSFDDLLYDERLNFLFGNPEVNCE